MHQPTAIWVHVRLETHGACVLPVLRSSTGGAQAPCGAWRQLRPRSVGGWFRLWRTPLGVGNADARVCVVLSSKDRKPETGRTLNPSGTTRRKATLTGALAPTKPLSALDICDRCGAQAYVRVLLANSGELLFCAHHGRHHAQALAKVAVDIQDESNRLSEPQPQ